MTEADIPDGLRLCRASGWNQQEEDWRLLLRMAEGRFRAAVLDGRVVATGGAALYGTRLAWICMILVDPDLRGRGIGTRIFGEVLGLLDDIEAVGLDATPAGRHVYVRHGFEDARSLVRMRTRVADVNRPDSGGAQALTPSALPAVGALDLEVFGADRSALLRWALERAPEYAWSLHEAGAFAGYCFGRHGHHSDHIGPVVARSVETARRLVAACLRDTKAEHVIVDVPVERREWTAALGELGFEEQRSLTRMYRGRLRPGRGDLHFAICGPELG